MHDTYNKTGLVYKRIGGLNTMVKFCVATDSGCDLPGDFCQKRNIHVYRMKYYIGEEEFTDQMNPEDAIELIFIKTITYL